MMRNTYSISDKLLIYIFLGISSMIMIGGVVLLLSGYRMLDNIGNGLASLPVVITFVLGIACLFAFPYCFRVSRTMSFVDISYSDPSNIKVTINPIEYSDGIPIPIELQIDELTSITQDKIFENLMEFSFEVRDETKTITSFIKEDQMNFIRNLSKYKSA